MATPVNPDTYALFLEVLTKAPRATTYTCVVASEITAGSRKGELNNDYVTELSGDKFDALPWDGEDDDILSAAWVVPAAYSIHCGVGVHDGRISMSVTHDGGIYVANPYGKRRMYSVGRVGVMPGNRSDITLSDPDVMERVTVDTDEEMVAKVLELLTAGGWENADEVIAQEREHDYDY